MESSEPIFEPVEEFGLVRDRFQSEEADIPVDIFAPATGSHPGIVLLHGANGLKTLGKPYQRFAGYLAKNGYVTFLVHYFEATGTTWADDEMIHQHFLRWMGVASDAVSFARGRPNVLADKIGLLGTSLGATLALSLAAARTGIAAVVEFFGGLPTPAGAHFNSMPPVLIVHGSVDRKVPVEEAYKLERLLQERDLPYDIKIYPDEGHIFTREAALDAARRAVAFLDEHVRGGASE
jgi:carboxymethylenebutenolidase